MQTAPCITKVELSLRLTPIPLGWVQLYWTLGWKVSATHSNHEISALEDFNGACVTFLPSQVARITGIPCTTWDTKSMTECEQHTNMQNNAHTHAKCTHAHTRTHTCYITQHTHTHTHTPPGMPITVSVHIQLCCSMCPSAVQNRFYIVNKEINSHAVRGLTWYLAVLVHRTELHYSSTARWGEGQCSSQGSSWKRQGRFQRQGG